MKIPGQLSAEINNDGTDTLASVEILRFSDQTINLAAPIVLDLAGTGLALTSLAQSQASFDLDGDGIADRTSWFGSGNGLLFLDRNGDGTLSNVGEMSFVDDKAGAYSDLDGLSAFDSDGDGTLSAADDQFPAFKLFIDANGDGTVDVGEVKTLADFGIASLTLAGKATEATWTFGDTTVLNTGAFTKTDGTPGAFADVAFAYQSGSAGSEHRQVYARQLAEATAASAITDGWLDLAFPRAAFQGDFY